MSQESTAPEATTETIEDCLICLEPLKRRVLLPCNHSPTCIKCFITYNMCYGKRICPFCQSEINSDPIITDSIIDTTYDQELKDKAYKHDDQYHVYYQDQSVIDELHSYQRYKCQRCGELFQKYFQLTQHLKTHKMTTCKICHHSHRFLPSQTPEFSHNSIKKHIKQHPNCPVCSFTAFDQSQLNEHMRENHFRCEICAEQGKILWFENLDLLQIHLHTNHFTCDHPQCVQQGFIAFATEFELQMHQIQVHGAKIHLTIDFKDDVDGKKVTDYRDEHRQRIFLAKKKLGQTLRNVFRNENLIQSVFDMLHNVQNQKMSVHQFIQQLNKTCGNKTDAVFCDVVAAISNPRVRANVIKERQGLNRISSPKISREMNQNFPTIINNENDANDNSEETVKSVDNNVKKSQLNNHNGGKKKQKKIVISSF